MPFCEVLGNIPLSILIPILFPWPFSCFPPCLLYEQCWQSKTSDVCDLEKCKTQQDATSDGVFPRFSICRPQPPDGLQVIFRKSAKEKERSSSAIQWSYLVRFVKVSRLPKGGSPPPSAYKSEIKLKNTSTAKKGLMARWTIGYFIKHFQVCPREGFNFP